MLRGKQHWQLSRTEVGVDRDGSDLEAKHNPWHGKKSQTSSSVHSTPLRSCQKAPGKIGDPSQTMTHYFASSRGELIREKTTPTTLATAVPQATGADSKKHKALPEFDCEKDGMFYGNI